MKIASSLSMQGIRTAEEAMSYFSNITNRASNNTPNNAAQAATSSANMGVVSNVGVTQPVSVAPTPIQPEVMVLQPVSVSALQESNVDE